jgi:ABC-type amino acid transport substrate-binding protein
MARSPFGSIVISAFVAAIVAAGVVWHLKPQSGGAVVAATSDQPAYERVMKTRTLRCAYFVWNPFFIKDPTTGAYSGINYDEVVQVAKILNLKLEITEEVPTSQYIDHLKSGRSDTFCVPIWPSGSLAGGLDFSMPVDYLGVYAMVRADDHRFDGDLGKLNSADVTVATQEAGYSQDIARETFPKAKQYAVSQDTDGSQLLLAVGSHKADVAFVDTFLMHAFSKSNPGMVKPLAGVKPVRILGDSFAVAKGETKLRDMLNVALTQMNQSGFFHDVLDKWLGEYKGEYYYPAQPYEK